MSWLNSYSRRVTPKDSIVYHIAKGAIEATEHVLKSYGELEEGHEGFVYWGGELIEGNVYINCVIAPNCESGSQFISTSRKSNAQVIIELSQRSRILIGQVHSHPSDWVDHSLGDDKFAAYKYEGLISIVVPEYCVLGMLPLNTCGIHRYEYGEFLRFSDKYVNNRFIINESPSEFVDLR